MSIYRHVLVLSECFKVITEESRKARFVETGGPLVGYVTEDDVLVVTNAIGPGPRSELKRRCVTIDGKFAQQFCDRMLRESRGRIDYVGDWHKHTGLSLTASNDDTQAMKTMANFEFCPTRHPISLIYRRWPSAFQIYVWDGSGRLKKISSSIHSADSLLSIRV